MQLPSLIPGTLEKRYKRFLADIILDEGQTITAHCPNSGSMLGVNEPGTRVWVSLSPNAAQRKYAYTWELVEKESLAQKVYVGINTALTNKLVERWLQTQQLPFLNEYKNIQREVPYGQGSRIDFLLSQGQTDSPECYVEVKSVHLAHGTAASFPDSPTQRGQKHLRELMAVKRQGKRAVTLYVVQRNDCKSFGIEESIDPLYAKLAREAQQEGVEFYAYDCKISLSHVDLGGPLSVIL